ncbi:MAG: DMT family transporter [Planctomycetota bacterium]|nr:MAG: DMT family transporter [Planctomycetota bacterium]REK30183.1 MAG: DMT family transporter [Planctomycetota bacterium]REK49279.1 MAG: DMT family transporter [Planctomycetota bacterium]
MAHFLFLFLCFIWGTNFMLMKKAMLAFDPLSVAWFRVAGGLLPLLLVWLWRRRPWSLGREHALPLLLVAIGGYSWPFVIQPLLIRQIGQSGFIGMMVCFVPLLTILVSIPMLGIFPKPRQVAGVVLGLICSAIILLDGREQYALSWATIALAISVPLFYATCNTYIKRRFAGVPALPLTMTALALSTVILAPVPFFADEHDTPVARGQDTEPGSVPLSPVATGIPDATPRLLASGDAPSPPPTPLWLPVACVVALGVIGTGLGVLIFTKLLQEQGPLYAGMVTYLIPLIALLWGAVDNEQILPRQMAAFAGVLAAVALVQFGALQKDTVPPVVE